MNTVVEFGNTKPTRGFFLNKVIGGWVDRLTLIDETEGRNIVMDFKSSTFGFYAWESMTKEEYDSVKSKYREIYK